MIIFSAVDDLDIGKREKQRFFGFLIDCLMFFINFTSPNTILFYSKQKVWIFPVILSPFPAPYDKISPLWLLAKFVKEWHFGEIWCILIHLPKIWDFEEISLETRNARFYRITTCDPALESFFRKLFDCKKNFKKNLVVLVLVHTTVHNPQRYLVKSIILEIFNDCIYIAVGYVL